MNDDDLEPFHQHNSDHNQTRHSLVENDDEEGKSSKKRGNRRGSNSSSSSSSSSNGDRKNDEKKGDSACNPGKEGPPDSSAVQPNHPSSDIDDDSHSCHPPLEPRSQQRDSNDSQKTTRTESKWEKRQKQRRRRDRRCHLKKQRQHHPQRLRIETANFRSQFHGALCRAARYKAHAPCCSCFRAVSFRERYLRQQREREQEQNEQKKRQPYQERNNGGTNIRADSKEEEESDNEPTVLIREFDKLQLTDLNISGKDGITGNDADGGIDFAADDNNNNYINNNNDDDDNYDPFDNLLVIPDTRSPSAIYSCRDTNSHRFRTEGTACEMKLAREIFFEGLGDDDDNGNDSSNNDNNNLNQSVPIPPFKLTCAQCLLRTHQPNAFLALCSDSFLDLHAIVQHAHRAADIPSSPPAPEKTRHADHAHFVASVTMRSLISFLPTSVTKKKCSRPLIKKVLKHLHRGGGTDVPDVFLPKKKDEDDGDSECDGDKDTEGIDADGAPRPVIEFGHHLTSLLYTLVNLQQLSQLLIEEKMKFIMVIGYRDGWNQWTLDLPGGKRHLGETTLQSLLREVEEECSLEMRVGWWMERMPRLYGGNNCCELDGNEIGKFNWDEVGGMDDGGDFVVFGKGGLDQIGNGNGNGNGNGTGERDDGGDFVVLGKNRCENSDGWKNNGLVHVLQTERKGDDNTDVFVVAVPPPRALQDEFLNMKS